MTSAVVISTLVPGAQAATDRDDDGLFTDCEWAELNVSTGFAKYDRLLGSRDREFWGDGSPLLVSIPLGIDARGHWSEKVIWVCPPIGYVPPRPARPLR
jgi:hypothetical protein